MTTSNQFVLLDGALARSLLNCDELVQQPDVWSIYGNLGAQAAAVGPILTTRAPAELIPADAIASATAQQRRAWGYAHSVLRAECDASTLAAHLRSIRYLHAHDGQRFYFRYADARCLLALWPALDTSQRGAMLGLCKQWMVRDATGQTVRIDATTGGVTTVEPLVLSEAALDHLTCVMWTWNLLGAAEDADASIADRKTDAEALHWCERATSLVNEKKMSGYAVETMLAVALIRSSGQAQSDPMFQAALQRAMELDDPIDIQRWIDLRFNGEEACA